jgi:nicotinamidase-related amidase
MTANLAIDTNTTALVVIDLPKGIMGRQLLPHSPNEVITNANSLIKAFRSVHMPVFLVHVNSTRETTLRIQSDITYSSPQEHQPDWSEFVPEIDITSSDIIITKRQWGAFYGTDLELHLRRRGIKTIVLCGVSTNIGVESTARFAYEFGFEQIFAEDAMSANSVEEHQAPVRFVFPRIGRVRKTEEILQNIL